MGLTASYCSNQRQRDRALVGLMYVLFPPFTLSSSDLVSFRDSFPSPLSTRTPDVISSRIVAWTPAALSMTPIHVAPARISLLHPNLLDFYSWMSLGHVKHTLSKAEPPISSLLANHPISPAILSILVTVSSQVALFESRGQKNRSFQIIEWIIWNLVAERKMASGPRASQSHIWTWSPLLPEVWLTPEWLTRLVLGIRGL